MAVLKGDYIGFTYNDKHSSDLGIMRVTNGSRFEENLLPTMQDKTVQVPGGDGTYYFGSYYTQKPFNVSFAFDSLTEEQVEEIKKCFGDKKNHELIFDERPYKAYRAKVTGTSTIKYIPFAEGETNRLYKGEGSIQFTCYFPYAICDKKFLNEYDEEQYPNKKEWAAASGLKNSQGDYDLLIDNKIKLYNPGVKESDCIITINTQNCTGYRLGLGEWGFELNWLNTVVPGYLIIDSKTGMIEGAIKSNGKIIKTGELFNEYMTSGDFFKIPLGESLITVEKFNESEIIKQDQDDVSIQYNYYYF